MLNFNLQYFEHIKSLTWEEVFDFWRKNEASNPAWIEHYKSRGFGSWEEWRQLYALAFKCAYREWQLYRITTPIQSIPTFHGGPFKTWIEQHYGGSTSPTFFELAARNDMQQHEGLRNLIANFPAETKITGLAQNGEITVIEGMHRCVAVALAANQRIQLITTIYIALADASGEELPVVGQYTKEPK